MINHVSYDVYVKPRGAIDDVEGHRGTSRFRQDLDAFTRKGLKFRYWYCACLCVCVCQLCIKVHVPHVSSTSKCWTSHNGVTDVRKYIGTVGRRFGGAPVYRTHLHTHSCSAQNALRTHPQETLNAQKHVTGVEGFHQYCKACRGR